MSASFPAVEYARSGGIDIAYQVVGSGPVDVVFVEGAFTNRHVMWEDPGARRFYERLGGFSRLILFDKRGMGLSDRVQIGTLEERMDDVRAVMDAVGSERAALIGESEGGPMSMLFAATYPERTVGLILAGAAGARYVELPGGDHVMWGELADVALAEIREFLTGVREVPEPDRVLATVLFTDLAGSTVRARALGDRRWRELLEQHHAAVRGELTRFSGREIDTAGDGFLAAFDGPARAIRCAKAIVQAVSRLGLGVRAGVHTGECEVVGGKLAGLAIHIGARVAAQAEPGEVLVSSTVRDLIAGSGIELIDRGLFELKGIEDARRLFAVA